MNVYNYYMKDVLIVIKYSLVESMFTRQSLFIRYLLKFIFGIEYNCADSELVSLLLPNKDVPQIFSKDINYIKNTKNYELEQILNIPLELKPLGNLFYSYTTTYPFDREKALEDLKRIAYSKGFLLIHENFFFWFGGYIPFYESTLSICMESEGILPVPWRYYIAIMAVTTIKSFYLLKHLESLFLINGGDQEWLIYGLDKIPEKLKSWPE